MIVNTVWIFDHFVSVDFFSLHLKLAPFFPTIQAQNIKTWTPPYCFIAFLIILTKFVTVKPELSMPFVRYFNSSTFSVFWWKRTEERRRIKARGILMKLVFECRILSKCIGCQNQEYRMKEYSSKNQFFDIFMCFYWVCLKKSDLHIVKLDKKSQFEKRC